SCASLGRKVPQGSGRSSAQSRLQRKKHSSQLTFFGARLPCVLVVPTHCLPPSLCSTDGGIKASRAVRVTRPSRKSQTKELPARKEPETSHLDVTIPATGLHFADVSGGRGRAIPMLPSAERNPTAERVARGPKPAIPGSERPARHHVRRCAFSSPAPAA